jgi:hypothetical protein
VKSKASAPTSAKDLYVSQLFRGLRKFAETRADAWYILSAEHGVVDPDQVLAPYERTLNTLRKEERQRWAAGVRERLVVMLPPGSEIIVLASERYREELVPFLRGQGHTVTIPFEGLSLGKQLQRLAAMVGSM